MTLARPRDVREKVSYSQFERLFLKMKVILIFRIKNRKFGKK